MSQKELSDWLTRSIFIAEQSDFFRFVNASGFLIPQFTSFSDVRNCPAVRLVSGGARLGAGGPTLREGGRRGEKRADYLKEARHQPGG